MLFDLRKANLVLAKQETNMHPFLKKTFYTIAVLISLLLGGGTYTYHQSGPLSQSTVVTISKGQSLFEIARSLEKEGIIRHPHIFALTLIALGKRTSVQAGEYEFEARASHQNIADKLTKGLVYLHKLTIPEGLTGYQVREILKAQDYLVRDTNDIPEEGTLLPETYSIPKGTTYSDLYKLMEKNLKDFLAEAWEKRASDLPFTFPYDALILASIVEKETPLPQEKPRVAAVFINRLKKGMLLQADPTVVYNLTKGQGKYGKKLLAADLKKDLSHNTYVHKGLPPTPIAMAGKEAILAVLNPMKIDDMYFVADGNGGHAFSPNLKTHNQNVLVYRRKKRKTL